MQSNRWLQALIVLLVIIAAGWLAGQLWSLFIQFSNIFILFFLSWLLAFILRPIARWLTNRGFPHTLAVLVVYLVLALVFTVAGFFLIPIITQQIDLLNTNFITYQGDIGKLANDAQNLLISWGVKQVDLSQFYSDAARQVQGVVLGVLQNIFSVLQSVATLVIQTILVFLLSFYFMKDGDRIFGTLLHLMPPRWQDEARLAALSVEKSFGGFIRGQVVFALVYGVLNAIVMMVPPFQLQFVLIASIVAGACMIIPLIGNFLAYIPPVLACLVTPGRESLWPWVLLAMFVMQSIMMNFLGPRIMSSAIGMHPLYVVAAMLVGGQVGGVWGALFGIPIAGTINLIGRPLMRRLRFQSPIYQESSTHALTTGAFVTGPLAASLAEAKGRESASPTAAPVAATTTTTVARTTTEPNLALPDPFDDDDLLLHRPPTLTLRAWRLVIFLLSRARIWAWHRARARASRQ